MERLNILLVDPFFKEDKLNLVFQIRNKQLPFFFIKIHSNHLLVHIRLNIIQLKVAIKNNVPIKRYI